jgi:pre-mRNA-processing factor 17
MGVHSTALSVRGTFDPNSTEGRALMLAPSEGPVNPFAKGVTAVGKLDAGGAATETFVNEEAFQEQYRAFERTGKAVDMQTGATIQGSQKPAAVFSRDYHPKAKKARTEGGEEESTAAASAATTAATTVEEDAAAVAAAAPTTTGAAARVPSAAAADGDDDGAVERNFFEPCSKFLGKKEVDYQGRPWTTPPPGVKADEHGHDSFIPKKCVKMYKHDKGVQCVEFFPGTGHLLLTAGFDGKCKVWDVLTDRGARRSYSGHTKAVRAVQFNSTGSHFLSSGHDKAVQLWDTTTGAAVQRFHLPETGYDVKYYPKNDNIFIVACQDNKLYQYDVRTPNDPVQEYNYHLDKANTVTFIEGGDKFVSTSDDKKVFVWEFGVPVPIRYIQDPEMQSIPSVTLQPSGEHMVGQSMDNKLVTYMTGNRVRQVKKKTFTGHTSAGYACKSSFSPNSRFLCSGDSLGMLYFWDWGSTRMLKKFQVHENGPCVGTAWHPLKPSMVATCGWDGYVKLWE